MKKDQKKRTIKQTTKRENSAPKARKSTVSPKNVSYQNYLLESLKDPEETAGYLNAALVEGDIQVFLLALQNVIQAQGGIAELAEKTNKSRTSLYKTLSKNGNPYLKNINDLLSIMAMHLAVVPNKPRNLPSHYHPSPKPLDPPSIRRSR